MDIKTVAAYILDLKLVSIDACLRSIGKLFHN